MVTEEKARVAVLSRGFDAAASEGKVIEGEKPEAEKMDAEKLDAEKPDAVTDGGEAPKVTNPLGNIDEQYQ